MSKNPLEPITGVVGAAMAVGLGAAALTAVVRLVELIAGPTCFTTPYWPHGADGADLAPGVALDGVTGVRLCLDDAAPWQRLLGLLVGTPTTIAQLGALLLLFRLLRRAARHGVHTTGTADDVRGLAWYLVLALPGAALAESVASSTLMHAAVTFDAGWLLFLGAWRIPWWAVLTGLALLSLAQVMRTSADMRAELEATV